MLLTIGGRGNIQHMATDDSDVTPLYFFPGIVLVAFPLLVFLSHENIPSAGRIYMWVVKRMTFCLAV